ncbi:hypothetical protein BKA23_1460 [Rudaeicoccus suwonensis]|uniref:Uncharacterized protein n=1 Tax=Rudaeicoccus suwonensis TaxID=657409 RepID=A0A561EAK6_9MICO|nr:hypothetical protein BKA23_1460 [Rudaeicoccus suwonensis]
MAHRNTHPGTNTPQPNRGPNDEGPRNRDDSGGLRDVLPTSGHSCDPGQSGVSGDQAPVSFSRSAASASSEASVPSAGAECEEELLDEPADAGELSLLSEE